MKTQILFFAAIFSILTFTSAQASPYVACREKHLDGKKVLYTFQFLDAERDIRDAKRLSVRVSAPYRSDTPSNPVSNQDKPVQPQESSEFQIERVDGQTGNALSFQLEGGGALFLEFVDRFGAVKAAYTRPRGPEMPRILNDCEYLDPEVGITGTTK